MTWIIFLSRFGWGLQGRPVGQWGLCGGRYMFNRLIVIPPAANNNGGPIAWT